MPFLRRGRNFVVRGGVEFSRRLPLGGSVIVVAAELVDVNTVRFTFDSAFAPNMQYPTPEDWFGLQVDGADPAEVADAGGAPEVHVDILYTAADIGSSWSLVGGSTALRLPQFEGGRLKAGQSGTVAAP